MQDIPLGHKVALKDMAVGDTVIKYGIDIGKVVAADPEGRACPRPQHQDEAVVMRCCFVVAGRVTAAARACTGWSVAGDAHRRSPAIVNRADDLVRSDDRILGRLRLGRVHFGTESPII